MLFFFISVEGELSSVTGLIYPGTDLILTCKPPGNSTGLKWTLNNNALQPLDKYVINNSMLIVKNASPSDSGTLIKDSVLK